MDQVRFVIRHATAGDVEEIYKLYKSVSRKVGGLARVESEITPDYINTFCAKAAADGIQLVVTDRLNSDAVVAEIHCYKLVPVVFAHVLSELTVAVQTSYQGMGIGKGLFVELLRYVTNCREDVHKVELIARESNTKALALYQSLGFVIEGRLANRIRTPDGGYEADIVMGWFKP